MNICYSGAAEGSDILWSEEAEKHNHKVVHYSFKGHQTHVSNRVVLSDTDLMEADSSLEKANRTLNRNPKPKNKKVRSLLQRNYYQIKDTSSVYAIVTMKDGEVQGGTAWAVQMAIDKKVPWIYVFDQENGNWYYWLNNAWNLAQPKKPSGKWTGIGTRKINEAGRKAIKEVFLKGW